MQTTYWNITYTLAGLRGQNIYIDLSDIGSMFIYNDETNIYLDKQQVDKLLECLKKKEEI